MKLFKAEMTINKHKTTGMVLSGTKILYIVASDQSKALEKIDKKMESIEYVINTTTLVSDTVLE